MAFGLQSQFEELVRCGRDPTYWIEKYCKIQHPIKGLLTFNMFPFQRDCARAFKDNRFNIILKARQLGISTIVSAYAAWLALFHKEKTVLIIATKRDIAVKIIKKVKTIVNNLPQWMLLSSVTTLNQQAIEFDSGSRIEAISTSEDAGRSHALSLLIVDEAAFIRDFESLWSGLYSTLSTGGNCIILSTPNGVGNQYHKLWVDAEAGLNEFNAIKLPWHVHPERDEAWFQNECKQLGSRTRVASELLCDFNTSSETFFSPDDLEWVRSCVSEPLFRLGFDKNVWIWNQPERGCEYVLSADVSRGDGRDYSAFTVIDVDHSCLVAEYKGKVPPDVFGEILAEFGKLYNNALVAPENNTYGWGTLTKLVELRYPKLYRKNNKGVYFGGYFPSVEGDPPGFETNSKTRIQALSKLEELLRRRKLVVRSSRFYNEAKTFVWNGAKPQAQRHHNDDVVMSLAIGAWLFDASDSHCADTRVLTDNMLKAMSVEVTSPSGDLAMCQRIGRTSFPLPLSSDTLSAGKNLSPRDLYTNFAWVNR